MFRLHSLLLKDELFYLKIVVFNCFFTALDQTFNSLDLAIGLASGLGRSRQIQ
jgi:hypothetical protein